MCSGNDGEVNLMALTRGELEARLRDLCPQDYKFRNYAKADVAQKLAEYYRRNPRTVIHSCAPPLSVTNYAELLQILESVSWHRYEVKARKYSGKARGGATHGSGTRSLAVGSQNFVLGATLGALGSGGFVKKGPAKGVGKNTSIVKSRTRTDEKVCMQLWKSLMRLVKAVDPSYAFTSIQVNRNFLGKPHTDSKDRSYQYALSLGAFCGGQLIVETDAPRQLAMLSTKGCLTKCDERRPHWVTPYEGIRYSVIMYRCLGNKTPTLSSRNMDTNARPTKKTAKSRAAAANLQKTIKRMKASRI